MRKLVLAATLAALVFAGCEESYTPVGKHQVLVQDSDGAVDQNNIARACGAAIRVAGWQTGHGSDAAVLVTCKP